MNPEYLIGIGLIVACIGIFFYVTSDTGLGITLLGYTSVISGAIIGLIQRKKS